MRQGQRLAAPLLLAALVCLSLPGCVRFRFGDHEKSLFTRLPQEVDPSTHPRGTPLYDVAVQSVTGTWNGAPYEAAPETEVRLTRRLRQSTVFRTVYAPADRARAPADGGRVWIESHWEERTHDTANVFLALLGGLVSYRYDLAGTTRLRVRLPPDFEMAEYEAHVAARRRYYDPGRQGAARQILLDLLEDALWSHLLDRLNADPRFLGTPPLSGPSDPLRVRSHAAAPPAAAPRP